MSGRYLLGQATSTPNDNLIEFASHVDFRDLPIAVDNVLLDCGEATSFRFDGHAISGARSSDRPLIKCSETTSYQDIISDQIPVDFQRYPEEFRKESRARSADVCCSCAISCISGEELISKASMKLWKAFESVHVRNQCNRSRTRPPRRAIVVMHTA